MTGARHLLVVASQCTSMGVLPDLDAVAGELHDVLRDGGLGGCQPGLPSGQALVLLTTEQTDTDVHTVVGEAIEHARACRATLVLALIGHGFIAGDDPTLYFMTPGSEEEVRHTAVNVNELLIEACDRPGVAGVIGIIDTCNAAAATVNLAKVTTGIQGGRTALSLIMASAVGQSARDLKLSRELTALVRAGSEKATPAVFAEDLDTPLRSRLGGQALAVNSYNGRDGGREALWVAANPRYAADQEWSTVSPASTARLAVLIKAVNDGAELPEQWDETALRGLKTRMAERGSASPAGWDLTAEAPRVQLIQLTDALLVATRTAAFLRSWLSASLTTHRLRSAVAQLRPGPGGSLFGVPGSAFHRVEHVVERIAVNHPHAQGGCRPWICRFVVALAQDAGRSLDAPELLGWAQSIDAVVQFNNAVEKARDDVLERRLRLIVSLHASPAGDWPPTLDAWLLDGTELIGHAVFRNRAVPDRAGTDEALAEAVDWAEEVAADQARGAQLQRLEIAAPTSLLLQWRPEEGVNDRRLGSDYDVVLRWSKRLNPPADRSWQRVERRARICWKRISAPEATAPVDWLSRREINDADELYDQLRNDRYSQAVGLDHPPGPGPMPAADLLDLFLTFSPVVLWPNAQDGFPSHCQDAFNDFWHTLPTGFTDAYRKQWRKDPDAGPAEIVARLRAVWDDVEWLDFCATNRRLASTRQGSAQ